jgi:hypothetical protein
MDENNLKFWLESPVWLKQEELPKDEFLSSEVDEDTLCLFNGNIQMEQLIARFSCYDKMIRVIFRVICLIKRQKNRDFTAEFYQETELLLLKLHQQEFFQKQIISLTKNKNISPSSKLSRLSPFIDDKGLLRVAGRLANCSYLTYDEKYPIIIENSKFSRLLINKVHKKFHAELFQTQNMLICIFKVKMQIKLIQNNCILCARYKSQITRQKLSDLPIERMERNRASHNTGIDLAGPFHLYAHKLRKATTVKVLNV